MRSPIATPIMVGAPAGTAARKGRARKRRIKEKLRGLVRPGGRARRYVHRRYCCESFFSELAKRQIRYVVLRWFDALPEIEPGEDVDLLVADDDLPKIADLFVRFRTPLACDIYSMTGLRGSDFRKMATTPPILPNRLSRDLS